MIRNILLVVFTFASSVSFYLKATSPRDRMAMIIYEMMEENGNLQRYIGSEKFIQGDDLAEARGGEIKSKTVIKTELELLTAASNDFLQSLLSLTENQKATMSDIFLCSIRWRSGYINHRNNHMYELIYNEEEIQGMDLISCYSEPFCYFYSTFDTCVVKEYHLEKFRQMNQLLFLAWSQMSHEERLNDRVQEMVKKMPSLWSSLYGEKPWSTKVSPDDFCGYKLFNIAYHPFEQVFSELMKTIKAKHKNLEPNDQESSEFIEEIRGFIGDLFVNNIELNIGNIRYLYEGFSLKIQGGEKVKISSSVGYWLRSFNSIDCLEDLAGGRFYYDRLAKWRGMEWKVTIDKYKQSIEKKKREEEEASKLSKPKHKGKKGKGKKRSGHKNRAQPNPEHFSTHFSMGQATEGAATDMPEEENDQKLLEAVTEVLDMDEEGEEQFEEAAAAGGEGYEEEADEAVENRQEKEFVYPDMVRKWASSTVALAQPRKELAETPPQFQRFLIDLFDPTKVSQITFKKFHKNWAAIGGKIAGFKNGGSHRLIQFPKMLMNQQKDAAASSASHMQTGNVSLWGTFDHKKKGFSYTADTIGPLRSAFVWAGYYPEGFTVK